MLKERAWEGACGAKDDEGGWALFAEIRVLNGGRGVQYDGTGKGTENEDAEKWGTSSRVTFYTLAEPQDGNGTASGLAYRGGKWKWDYEMDLVRRYDLPFGLGRYKSYMDAKAYKEEHGDSGEYPYSDRLLIFALHDFLNSASFVDGGGVNNDTSTYRNNHTGYDVYNAPQNKSENGHLWDFSPYFNRTNLTSTTTATTTAASESSTSSAAATTTTTKSTLTDLKKPYLSTSDLLSTPKPIPNPFPIFKPPSHQASPFRSSYPPIQKVVYYLGNSTWRATLTNTTSPGFPALEEVGGWDAGGAAGVTFVFGGGGSSGGTGAGASGKSTSGGDDDSLWTWKWETIPRLARARWRWDGFFPKIPGVGSKDARAFGGLCLPPRVRLRRRGRRNEVLKTVEVLGGGCGVVRVCGVAGGGGEVDRSGGGDGDEGEGWRSGGWKRSVEERWAVVVGLVAWEVERWGGCCAIGE
ncbi:hypothetical protein DFH27DRAFT_638902 [Peziza echinospora]|nr:hypothetical protein DFH27DRAFT_638902 [Peziza echinospora]